LAHGEERGIDFAGVVSTRVRPEVNDVPLSSPRNERGDEERDDPPRTAKLQSNPGQMPVSEEVLTPARTNPGDRGEFRSIPSVMNRSV
jgi:hypothetical protein